MKRVWTLVAGIVATLAATAPRAGAAPANVTPDGAVLSVSVVPATGRAEVVVGVDGAVTVHDFLLHNPDKIVVDVSGAALGLPANVAYDNVSRGGITNIRYSQYRKNIVRVVLTLDGPRQYTLVRGEHEIRITVAGAGSNFAMWSAGEQSARSPMPAADKQPRRVAAAPKTEAAPAPAPKAEAPKAVKTETPKAARVEAPAKSMAKVDAPKSEAPKPAPAKAEAPRSSRADVSKDDMAMAEPLGSPMQQGSEMAPSRESEPVSLDVPTRRLASPALHADNVKEMPQRAQQPRITIAWENADIHDVLAAFAAFAGRTIIPSKDVKGQITAEINNQPWDVAMRALLNANGFDATEDQNGIIIVDTFEHIAARRSTEPVETRMVRLNYVRAAQVAPLLEPRLSRDCGSMAAAAAANAGAPSIQPAGGPTCPVRGAVTADSLTNSVAITDVPSALEDLVAYARSLDLRQPQVNIKARIILIDRTQLEGLGLRYDLGTRNQFFNDIIPRLDSTGKARTDAGQVFLGGNEVSAIANAQARIPSSALQLVYSTAFGNYSLSTFLEALQQLTLLDVQAEPSATVLNNRTANLTAGTDVPLRIIDASAGGSGGTAQTSNFPRATVQIKPTGIILNVTPSVTNNRQVQMRLHVENSDVVTQGTDSYIFPKQTVDNEVLVADGETAVMGGLTQTSVRLTKSGIPVLVDLPLIGRLFGMTQRTEEKRDLLILVTPHIIDEGQTAPPSR